MKQKTLGTAFTLTGKGLHTGLQITMSMKPAPANTGIIIRRTDLPFEPIVPALAEYVTETTRGTVLRKDNVQVSTVEHGMAALNAFGIDNCIIEVDAPEFPILDGSARFYVEELKRVGTVEQEVERNFLEIKEKIVFTQGESQIEILPADHFSVEVEIGFDSPVLKHQEAKLDDMSKFADEVASCRTFVFVREIEPLLKMNLIKGGDLNNAIVIYDRPMEQSELQHLAELLGQPCPEVDNLGYLNPELRFDNEPARHKLLDLIGDLMLVGCPIKGKVVARHPGHGVNTALGKQIRKDLLAKK